jgi:hypothetical protein
MPGEEAGRGVELERRDTSVPAEIGVRRLLPRAEGVEQVQGQPPVVPFVVPLQQNLQRTGATPAGLLYLAAFCTPRQRHFMPRAGAGYGATSCRRGAAKGWIECFAEGGAQATPWPATKPSAQVAAI